MDKVIEINEAISKLSYREKEDLFSTHLSLGTFSSDTVNDKLVLISLVSILYIKLKEKDSSVTPLKILLKITGQKEDDSGLYQLLETISLLVNEFSYQCKRADTFGLSSSKQIVNKIKEILSAWIPF